MNQTNFEIRQLAQKIIDNQIDFIAGCRKTSKLSSYLNDSKTDNLDKYLLVIRGVDSESDHFPLGKVRETCSQQHLSELDVEKEDFIAFYRPIVLDSCQSILKLV